jgi:hypothetical protein
MFGESGGNRIEGLLALERILMMQSKDRGSAATDWP